MGAPNEIVGVPNQVLEAPMEVLGAPNDILGDIRSTKEILEAPKRHWENQMRMLLSKPTKSFFLVKGRHLIKGHKNEMSSFRYKKLT